MLIRNINVPKLLIAFSTLLHITHGQDATLHAKGIRSSTYRRSYYPSGKVDSYYQTDNTNHEDGSRILEVMEEERYTPAAFNIEDYGGSNGNGMFLGHAIEMMAPVEIPEYGWKEELDNGAAEDRRVLRSELQEQVSGQGHTLCGDTQINPSHSICCNGLVYRKTSAESGKCCGSVAYDDRFFTCCQGRAIVRRTSQQPLCCGDYSRETLPDQCRNGYERDSTGLGSTCCKSGSSGWQCCLKGGSCCTSSESERSTAIDVPGFRPACCHLSSDDQTAQCCSSTFEKIRILPDCCSGQKLKPICCHKQDKTRVIKCCPATVTYCCRPGEVIDQSTYSPPPELMVKTTRAPIVTHPARRTYAPDIPKPQTRPSYSPPRPIRTLVPIFSTSYLYSHERQSVTPRGSTTMSSCCTSKIPQRQCCSGSSRATCCRKIIPRCCIYLFFNPTCCRAMQAQQQMQEMRLQRRAGETGINDTNSYGFPHDSPQDISENQGLQNSNVEKVLQLRKPDPSTSVYMDYHLNSNLTSSTKHRRILTVNCCRLNPEAAITCCREGYRETGRLPACCVSSPVEHSDLNDDDKGMVADQQELTLKGQHIAPRGQNEPTIRTIQNSDLHRRVSRDEICNGISFDTEEYLCCKNTLRKRIGVSPACCDTVAYDEFLYRCCEGKVRISCQSNYKVQKSIWGIFV